MRSAQDATDAAPGNMVALTPHKKRNTRRCAEDYDGSVVKRTRPKDYRVAVKMLGAGIAKNRISDTVGVCWSTVAGIERVEISDIQHQRRLLAERAYSAASASLDSACERAMVGKATALDASLLTDTWLKLEGQSPPPQTHVHCFAPLAEWESLGNGGQVIDRDV